MKQCPKCVWRAYCYTEPICENARRILHDTDIANEIFKGYKNLDCLNFIDRGQTETSYTTVDEGQVDNFQDLIDEYQKLGRSKRVLNIFKELGVKNAVGYVKEAKTLIDELIDYEGG